MNNFKSYSQAGQDRFVVAVLNGKRDGTFLDIGCCHPTELSNTYALETEFGWRGLLVDNDPGAVKLCSERRKARVVHADSTWLDFEETLRGWHRPMDYLSLDVDAASLRTLENLMSTSRGGDFRVITIEHDSYRFGPGPRDAMRAILKARGYDLVCADVQSADGVPYEDWWVAPGLSAAADHLRCKGKKWTEILSQ